MPVSILVGAVAAGDDLEEVARDYGLALEDVRAALSYAAKLVEAGALPHPIISSPS